MGSVQRARSWVYGKSGLRQNPQQRISSWSGSQTWLQVLFLSPLMIFGFGFGKDELFLRWLFLERARLHKRLPKWAVQTWFIETGTAQQGRRDAFFEGLGIKRVTVEKYADLYDNPEWCR